MNRLCLCVCAFSLGVPVALQGAEGWTEFRGPQGNGISPAAKLPLQWGNRKNVAWKQTIPGEGWSSPVVDDGRVYLTSAVPKAGSVYTLKLFVLSEDSGAVLNTVDVFDDDGSIPGRVHRKNRRASPTPVIRGDRIYVHFGHQGTACIDKAGKILWKTRKVRYAPVHGNGGSPLLLEDRLIFSCDGRQDPFIVCLDANTGKEMWRKSRPETTANRFSFTTPIAIEVDGKTQVISPGSGSVCAYDPADGTEIWRVMYGDGYSVIPRPLYAHGLVYVCTGYGTPNLLAIQPTGKGDVTNTHVKWQYRRGVPHTPSLLIVGNELYMVSDRGMASCLDARTGKRHWQQRLPTQSLPDEQKDGFSASPVYASGKIYFQSENGVGTVVEAARQFRQLAVNRIGERTLASYAISRDAFLIRSANHLYRIAR